MSDKSTGYTITGSGTNTQGNHWCSRQGDNGGHGYHYSNRDGSCYYKNTNDSTYHNDGRGNATYTPPSSQGNSGGK